MRTKSATRLGAVAVGSDHGGFDFKERVVGWLQALGYEVADMGTHSKDSCDYPLIAKKVAMAVASGDFDQGVLICKTGIGMAICANKIKGVRAGVCSDLLDAERARAHNNTNVLVFGAEKVSFRKAKAILEKWFATGFDSNSRHGKRVHQIDELEEID